MVASLLRLTGLVVAVYALYLALLFVQQRSMMFPGPDMRLPALAGLELPPGASRVLLPASFGEVQAVWLHARDAGVGLPAAIYLHGNAESVGQNLHLLGALARRGMHVLLVEYPGYAGSDGRPSKDTLIEAARLGYDFLAAKALPIDPQRIVVIGRSIGSGPAAELVRMRAPAALVLLSPFSELDGFAHRMGAPVWLIRDRFDNAAAVAGFDGPVLLFHGRRDGIIPFEHSRRLNAAARAGTLVALDCGHNDCPYFDEAFMQVLEAFLRAHGLS